MSNPAILAIETSIETGSVAFWANDQMVIEREFFAGRRPSETLWPVLEEVMAEVDSLDAIVVGIGPGSYNGSRVGIAGAQGIALVHQCPVVPICSFEGVATSSEETLAVGDARRGTFSLQAVQRGRIAGNFSLVAKEELEAAIKARNEEGQEVFSFDAPERFPIDESLTRLIQRRKSEAGLLAKAFCNRTATERQALLETLPEPFYLRDPHITVGKRKSLLKR